MNDEPVLRTAIAFPGMGPISFGDVAKFLLMNSFARRLTAAADEALGYSVHDGYHDSAGDQSEFADVSFLISCLAVAEWAEQEHGLRSEFCVGASFGGKAAAVWSGALSFADAVRMTAGMARCEREYFARTPTDLVTQSFARTPADHLATVLRELDEQGEWYELSAQVDHDFAMLSVRERCLDWLQQRLRQLGGLPIHTMRPAMHTSVLGALRDKVEEEVFGDLTFTDPVLPVVSDQDGTLLRTGAEVRRLLLDGYVRQVRWPAVVAALKALDVATLCVAGPDKLFGRVECTTSNFEVLAVNPRTVLQPRQRTAVV